MADYYQPATTTTTTDDTTESTSPNGDVQAPPQEMTPAQPPAPEPASPIPPTTEPSIPAPPPPPPKEETAQGSAGDDKQMLSYDAMVDRLIKQLGFENVPEPQKANLVEAIKERIETRVLRVLMTSLTEEQTRRVDEKIKQESLDEKAIIELLTREAPNASDTIVGALDDLYMEMKQEVDTLMGVASATVVNKQQK